MYKLAIEAQSSLLKGQHRFVALNCRIIIEAIVKDQIGENKKYFHNLEDRIDHLQLTDNLKEKLHYIRRIGNKAAHNGNSVTHQEAYTAFNDMHRVCAYFYPPTPSSKSPKLLTLGIGIVSAVIASIATAQTIKHIEENRKK